jgi:hypothetical protein
MTDTIWPPPFTLKPVYSDPGCLDTGEGAPDDIHWSISWGFALNIDHDDPENPKSPLTIEAHFSDADQARGFAKAQASPEQLERFALLILAKVARYRQDARR